MAKYHYGSQYPGSTEVNIPIGCFPAHWDAQLHRERVPILLEANPETCAYFASLVGDARAAGCESCRYFTRNCRSMKEKCDVVKFWVCKCHEDYGSKCETGILSSTDIKRNFILIDVERHCLVDSPTGCRHVTLSNVWGKESFFQLTRANLANLRRPGGLLRCKDPLPRTIKDAMDVIHISSERFLWIDSLCIVQDDTNRGQDALNSMAQSGHPPFSQL